MWLLSALLQVLSREAARKGSQGPLKTRADLLRKKFMGKRVFSNFSGFMRLGGLHELFSSSSTHPLDCTRIHPGQYPLAIFLCQKVMNLWDDEEEMSDKQMRKAIRSGIEEAHSNFKKVR